MCPEISEKIKVEVMNQFNAGFFAVMTYPQWVKMWFWYLIKMVRWACV